jgi:hypothetical protein
MLPLPEGVSFAEADLKAIHRSQTRTGCTACIMDLPFGARCCSRSRVSRKNMATAGHRDGCDIEVSITESYCCRLQGRSGKSPDDNGRLNINSAFWSVALIVCG